MCTVSTGVQPLRLEAAEEDAKGERLHYLHQTRTVAAALRSLICLAAVTQASSCQVYGVKSIPCHFSSVMSGKRAMVPSAAGVKPPPAVPFGSEPWKNFGMHGLEPQGNFQLAGE